MEPKRPRVSPQVVADLQRKLHQDDASEEQGSLAAIFSLYPARVALTLLAAAWLVFIAAAPVLLLLFLVFDVNYTAQWIIAAAWLLFGSTAGIGITLLVGGLYQAYRGRAQRWYVPLLAGIGLLSAAATMSVLVMGGTQPPLMVTGANLVLIALGVGWGVYELLTAQQTPLFLRLLFLLAMLCLSASLITSDDLLQQALFGIPGDREQWTLPIFARQRALHTIDSVLTLAGVVALALSQVGQKQRRQNAKQ